MGQHTVGCRSALVEALNAEWDQLDRASRGQVMDWAERHPALAGCRRLADLPILVRERPDAVLGLLISQCQAGDQLAGRVVVQAMLGKIILMAAADPVIGIDDYLAVLWVEISRYRLDRRPRRVAANLALDTRKSARSEDRRRVPATPWPPEVFADRLLTDPPHWEPSARELIMTARRLGVINEQTFLIMTTVYGEGRAGAEAAARHGVSPEMVRYRCSDGRRRMQRHAAALRAAA